MYAIKEDAKKINGVELQTFCREVQNARTEIEVEAGTTGFKGGCCRDKGARAFLAIDCNQGDFFFDPKRDENGRVVGIAIACCGDDALASLIDTLGFAKLWWIKGEETGSVDIWE